MLDDLLRPISGDLPQGSDERGSDAYGRLSSAIRRARLAESSEQPPKPEVWCDIARDASEMLRDKTKNLHVAAMLVEAKVRSNGFSGLEAGAKLLTGLIDRYWDVLYPLPYPGEEEDVTVARLKPLQDLGTVESMLVIPLRKQELFRLDDGTAISLTTCLQARDSAREGRPGHRPWAEIVSEAARNQTGSIETTFHSIASARIAWLALGESVKPHTGGRPLGRPLMDMLEQVLAILEPLVPPQPDSAPPSGLEPAEHATAGTARPVRAQGDFVDREEALRALGVIAGYFRRMEPTSPLASTLDDAIRRARMSWVDLMGEVVTDKQAREQLLHRLGIRPPE